MIIGGVDTGKSHLCAELCSAGFRAGVPSAVVDADVGQSEVGAPGTIGMAIVDKEIESLSELNARRLYFVGATTPASHMLECAIGTKKMVDAALNQGAGLVVVDTTGMVGGPLGRKLKTYKTDLVRPDYLVGLQKRREIEHLLVPFAKIQWIKVKKLATSELARRKPPEFRTARRQLNFYSHFHDAPGHIIRLDDVSLWNTRLRTGRPMKWQYMKFIEDALKCRVLHAEITGNGVFIVSQKLCSQAGLNLLEEEFRTKEITVTTGETFKDLLVGLADENGSTINVGLVQSIDFKERFMFVLSPIKTISPIRVVQFGSMRVTRDGKELGSLSPHCL